MIGPDMKPASLPLHIANHKYNQTFLFSDQSTIGKEDSSFLPSFGSVPPRRSPFPQRVRNVQVVPIWCNNHLDTHAFASSLSLPLSGTEASQPGREDKNAFMVVAAFVAVVVAV